MRSNSQFLGASVNEFIQIWALGGDANLNLSTNGGRTTVSFNCTIGPPGAPHFLPPSPAPAPAAPPPPHRPRHRGPSEKERNRLRAARHQAAQVEAAAPVSSSPPVLSSTETSPTYATAAVVSVAPVPNAAPVPVPVPVNSPATVLVTPQLPAQETPSPVTVQVNAPSFLNIESVKLTPEPKPPAYVPGTEYSRANFSQPGNAPSPPSCEKCGNPTYWSTSRVRQDLGWLHEYVCLCMTRKCINTPPVS